MAFDSTVLLTNAQNQPPMQQLQQQIPPQQQPLQPQQLQLQQPIIMGKYKVKREIGHCGSTLTGPLSTNYPVELLNHLSNEEYVFIIDKLNNMAKSHRKYINITTIIYITFLVVSNVPLIIGTIYNNLFGVFLYLSLAIMAVVVYIVVLIKKIRKSTCELTSTIEQLNLVYLNRNIKLNTDKSSRGKFSSLSYVLSIHYPCPMLQMEQIQMYYTQQPQQQILQQSQQPQYVMYSPQPYIIQPQQPIIEKGLSYKINNNNENTPLL